MFRYIFVFTLLLHLSLSQDLNPSEVGDPTDNSTTEIPGPSSTEAPSTKPPTTEAPTTEPPTTEAPTTEPPTTEAPTTEPPTTEAPTTPEPTTTEPVPSTTPTPEWKPGNWTVHDNKNNVTCILAVMALEFKIPYEKTDGKNATAVLMVPPSAIVEGTCQGDNDTQTMSLAFPSENHTDSVSFVFASSGSASKNFIISSIELNFYKDSVNFPNASTHESATFKDSDINLFLTQVGKSYKCKSKIEVTMTQDDGKVNATLVMEEAQIEAFRTVNDAKFGVPMLCSADEFTSDIVPIAVGCALAALVVIVIVAYLIGRRRARAKGYQSM